MLTKRQYELLCFLIDYKKANHIFPSYDEVCQSMGLHSKSHVRSLLEGLEQKGFIRRIPHKARAIEIIKYPEELTPQQKVAESQAPAYQPPSQDAKRSSDYIRVPFYGAISSTI